MSAAAALAHPVGSSRMAAFQHRVGGRPVGSGPSAITRSPSTAAGPGWSPRPTAGGSTRQRGHQRRHAVDDGLTAVQHEQRPASGRGGGELRRGILGAGGCRGPAHRGATSSSRATSPSGTHIRRRERRAKRRGLMTSLTCRCRDARHVPGRARDQVARRAARRRGRRRSAGQPALPRVLLASAAGTRGVSARVTPSCSGAAAALLVGLHAQAGRQPGAARRSGPVRALVERQRRPRGGRATAWWWSQPRGRLGEVQSPQRHGSSPGGAGQARAVLAGQQCHREPAPSFGTLMDVGTGAEREHLDVSQRARRGERAGHAGIRRASR